jgi:tRNA G10  N-methylase Trm11
VANALIENFTTPGETILDPFCGSGTLAIEAAISGRNCVSVDIDPVAVFVARTKTLRFRLPYLLASINKLQKSLARVRRSEREYNRRQFRDIADDTLWRNIRSDGLWVPDIPNIQHWFRKYVLVDLARVLSAIERLQMPASHRNFLRLCFASILRNSSNADPVPVSGLEVTSHMLRKDAEGRIINPFALFDTALDRALTAVQQFCEVANRTTTLTFHQADATDLSSAIDKPCDAVITSPPYHNAVDYYRRHTLEMYWLGFAKDKEDRLTLLPKYIGRASVPSKHELLQEQMPDALALRWESKIRRESPARANAFKHYVVAMRNTLSGLAKLLPKDGPAVFVVGRSTWNGCSIPTAELFASIASPWFKESERLWYPIKNRYMSYKRRNGANIDREYVIVLRKR